jgi:transcriptional regulator with XRE-family HTH domain
MSTQSKLKICRQISRLTQTGLAIQAGISQAFLSRIEAGLKKPSSKTKTKIAAALNLNPGFIFPEDEVRKEEQ